MTPTDESTSDSAVIEAWIGALNAHDTAAFLRWFTATAVLEDPGVGTFETASGIAEYYRTYFVEYRTVTRVLDIRRQPGKVSVLVHFTGDFPGGTTRGTFDLVLEGAAIAYVRADLAE